MIPLCKDCAHFQIRAAQHICALDRIDPVVGSLGKTNCYTMRSSGPCGYEGKLFASPADSDKPANVAGFAISENGRICSETISTQQWRAKDMWLQLMSPLTSKHLNRAQVEELFDSVNSVRIMPARVVAVKIEIDNG